MRIPHAHTQRRGADVAMTPMIDVVFLLLIFFVCTASFQASEQTLPTHLLAVGGSEVTDIPPPAEQLERVVIKLRVVEGRTTWRINERPYRSLAEVGRALRAVAAIDASVPVILDAGGQVPLGAVIDVYDLCRAIGFGTIQFAASVEI